MPGEIAASRARQPLTDKLPAAAVIQPARTRVRKEMLHRDVGFVRRRVDVEPGIEALDVLDEMRGDAEMLMRGIHAEHP